MSRQLKPLHVFPDIDEFVRRHKNGTEAEFAADQKLVDAINKEENKFQAWVLSKTRQTSKRSEYVVIVRQGSEGARKIPQQGEPARLRIVFADNTVTRFWEARRIENPSAFLSATTQSAEKLAAFQVTVHVADAHEGVKPLLDNATAASAQANPAESPTLNNSTSLPDLIEDSGDSESDTSSISSGRDRSENSLTSPEPSEGIAEISLSDEDAVHVNFLLSASEATKNAELGSLDQLFGRYAGNVSERQLHAFHYFVLLRNPEFFVDLHDEIPHLKGAMRESSWPDSPLAKKFAMLDSQQKAAYLDGFSKLPCGICTLPGGPGAGKTHFNLFTIAMAQSRPLPRPIRLKGDRFERRCAKVLFIVDMNSPVDDVANRMVRLYEELGLKKSIIRMRGWGAEVKQSDRLNAAEDAAAGEQQVRVDFTNNFLRTANLMSHNHGSGGRSCKAPSLDEAAWQRFDQARTTEYLELGQFLEEDMWENSELVPLRLRRLVYNLYRDTLDEADFIATTPVAASNHFRGMFKPDLVYFDEAPHARELSNLIAVANFDPIAWIFCGDYRQTVPYVGSDDFDNANIYREQMQVSMMERAAKAKTIRYELLMNHRAFGGLHQLASTMWYSGRMVSGNEHQEPASLGHMRQYLERFTNGRPCTVPRLLVHVNNCGPDNRDGTSSWNPIHTAWVMGRVCELVNDPEFKQAEGEEPGTILIISPYKKAYMEYKNAIRRLPHWAQRRVEARTVDVVQGHEADFVFLDLVKNKSTKFLDNPNRLCVAVTRARIGEIIMMHPGMVHSTTFLRNSKNLRPIYSMCESANQVVCVDAEQTASGQFPETESRIDSVPAPDVVRPPTIHANLAPRDVEAIEMESQAALSIETTDSAEPSGDELESVGEESHTILPVEPIATGKNSPMDVDPASWFDAAMKVLATHGRTNGGL